MNFSGTPPLLLAGKLARVAARHPGDVGVFLAWAARAVRRCRGLAGLVRAAARRQVSAKTFEVHSFMDAADVAPAWELMQAGQVAEDPAVRATQERLAACAYTMAHPETGQLVPACAQHSVLDPAENRGLRRLLPLTVVSTSMTRRLLSREWWITITGFRRPRIPTRKAATMPQSHAHGSPVCPVLTQARGRACPRSASVGWR